MSGLAGVRFRKGPTKRDGRNAERQRIDFAQRESRKKRILATRARIDAKWNPKIPKVRKVNFELFKNHYYGSEPDYAIEVLVGGPNITDQIRREQIVRSREELLRIRREYLALGRQEAGVNLGFGMGMGMAMSMPVRSGGDDGAKRRVKRAEKEAEKADEKDKDGKDKDARDSKDKEGKDGPATDVYIHRVRIQSQPVLAYLTGCMGVPEHRSRPRTFVRPFKPLIYFQPQMRMALENLEKLYGHIEHEEEAKAGDGGVTSPVEASGSAPTAPKSAETGTTAETPKPASPTAAAAAAAPAAPKTAKASASQPVDPPPDSDTVWPDMLDRDSGSEGSVSGESDLATIVSDDGNPELIKDGVEALRDMRCYVDFVDREILPLHNRYQQLSVGDPGAPTKVVFDDMWSLFRVGELIYMPCTNGATERYHELWCVYRIRTPEPDLSYPDADFGFFGEDEFNNTGREDFILYCYYIDFDGAAYGAVRHKFRIRAFAGEREIDSLEVYPLRYLNNHTQLLATLTKQGATFQHYLTDRHQAYNAWTLIRNPPGDSNDPDDEVITSTYRTKVRHPEFVESHVIVDFAEALQANPERRPAFHRPSTSKSIACFEVLDTMPVQQWADRSRTKLLYSTAEALQKADGVAMRERRDNIVNRDMFLKKRSKDSRTYGPSLVVAADGSTTAAPSGMAENDPDQLSDMQRALLPRRMFAYSLRERRFVLVDLRMLKPVFREQSVFDNLKIRREYKQIVRGLVESHFEHKDLERHFASQSTESLSQDLIQGKGRGLIILLHGVPGVGKTATAEAVASTNKKPLFVITCGDLGLTPDAVESSLTKIFRLAHLWDCVLLLDEADVFLSQRSRLDMKRNALVSVFLRVLEYYNGLLFLTTNRVGTIDEAFKSRIHMFLYYPPLGPTQIEEIFALNIKKLQQMEDQRHKVTGLPAMTIRKDEILAFAKEHAARSSPKAVQEALAAGNTPIPTWNGRQIRNAFQVAAGLAHHQYSNALLDAETKSKGKGKADDGSKEEASTDTPTGPVLGRGLFEDVQSATQDFEAYMREAKGWDDADLAYMLGERADHMRNAKPKPGHFSQSGFAGGGSGMSGAGTGGMGMGGIGGMGGMGGMGGLHDTNGMHGVQNMQNMQNTQSMQSTQNMQGMHGMQGMQGYGVQGYGVQGMHNVQNVQNMSNMNNMHGVAGMGNQGMQGGGMPNTMANGMNGMNVNMAGAMPNMPNPMYAGAAVNTGMGAGNANMSSGMAGMNAGNNMANNMGNNMGNNMAGMNMGMYPNMQMGMNSMGNAANAANAGNVGNVGNVGMNNMGVNTMGGFAGGFNGPGRVMTMTTMTPDGESDASSLGGMATPGASTPQQGAILPM